MPTFQYTGIKDRGLKVRDLVEAENERIARSKLRRMGIHVVQISQKSSRNSETQSFVASLGGRVSLRETVNMTRQLATLVKANIPVVDALSALVEQISNPKLKPILMDVRRNVEQGKPLADSLEAYPKIFSQIYVSMVRVGEASGTLDLILQKLAAFSERDFNLRAKIKGAMTYPMIMIFIAFSVMAILMTFVVPKITSIFKDMKKDLPFTTELLIASSDFLLDFWWLIILGTIGGFLMIRWYITTPAGRARWDRFILKLPVLGPLSLHMAVSRFAQTLSTLLGGGVTLLDAIAIVKTVVDNNVIRLALESASQEIIEGKTIAKPLEKSNVFPPMVIHMIGIGERTGEMEPMLDIISESFETEVDTQISTLTTVLEPAMMVIMGVIIGLIVYSIVTPLLEMSNIS